MSERKDWRRELDRHCQTFLSEDILSSQATNAVQLTGRLSTQPLVKYPRVTAADFARHPASGQKPKQGSAKVPRRLQT